MPRAIAGLPKAQPSPEAQAQPMASLAEVLREHWPQYSRLYAGTLHGAQRAAVAAIMRCHSQACGGGIYHCELCKKAHFMPHGCGHRACPQCGHHHAQRWIEAQIRRLLPVPYFMVTFTVPEPLRALFAAHASIMIEVLFAQSAGALGEVAARPKYLGGHLGLLGVLHTWSRQLIYHPHVHYVLPAIALNDQGGVKAPAKAGYLLPVEVLKARYRSRMREALGQHPDLMAQVPSKVWTKPWVVNIKAVGKGRSALGYLGAYVFKTAMSSTRILQHQNARVRFSFKDYDSGQTQTRTLEAHEFIRRFLQHVLPKGLHRVRHFGWLSPASRKRFERVCAILDALGACEPVATPEPLEVLCPDCGRPMRLLRTLSRGPPCR